MMNHLLTVRAGHGDMESSRYAYRAGPLTLNHQAHQAPSRRRFFVPAAITSMAVGSGHPSGWPVPGPVLATHCQPLLRPIEK